MTDDEIRIAIADASGLQARYGLRKRGLWYRPDAKGYTGMSAQAGRYTLEEAKKHECVHGQDDDVTIAALPLPNYPEDLNAVHELEKKIKPEDWGTYTDYICGTKNQLTWWSCAHATALQRCEAYLRTIGKWK